MKSENFKAVGERIKKVRKDAGLTQNEFAERLNSSPSFLSRVESGKQRASHALVEAIQEQFGVSIGWLWGGDTDRVAESNFTDYVVNNMPEKASRLLGQSLVSRAKNASYIGKLLVRAGKGSAPPEQGFGYVGLRGIKIRLAAVREPALESTRLLDIASDDNLWIAAGEPDGWEFEILRGYFDFGGDRTLEQWIECLRVLRWLRDTIALAMDGEDLGSSEEARSA